MGWTLEDGAIYRWDGLDLDLPILPRGGGFSRVSLSAAAQTSALPHIRTLIDASLDSKEALEGISYSLCRADNDFIASCSYTNRRDRRLLKQQYTEWLVFKCEGLGSSYSVRCIGLRKDRTWDNEAKTGILKADRRLITHNALILEQRYMWQVSLRLSDAHVGIGIATDPTGVLAMLKDREKTGDRRKALLHWVQNHARKNRAGGESEVRAHLRGERRCTWRGYLVEIRPSEYERDTLIT